MKHRLLELIVCPLCHGNLQLEVFSGAQEVEEGKLTCAGCHREFPIINGIPRLLPDELAVFSVQYHPEFFERYAGRMEAFLSRCQGLKKDQWWSAERRTLKSYSYQWRTFKEMRPHWEELFQYSIHPIRPEFFPGKIGLDAGCGFGRSLYYAATYGTEVIGLDLSEAVEAARENTRYLNHVHLIQGDIFHPPLKDGSLDFVYSIGVILTLPNPRAGFLRLSRLLKPGAPIFIWLYSRGRGRQIAFVEALRRVSTKLPYRLLNGICYLFASIHWMLWIAPYKLFNRLGMKSLASMLPFTYHARYPFRVLHTDWFDGLSTPLHAYYRREEIESWLKDGGLDPITMDSEWGTAGGGRALGYAPHTANSVQHTAHRIQEAKSV